MKYFCIAQLKKDFQWAFSYKISFLADFVGIFLSTYTFFFLSKTFEFGQSSHLTQYQNNYFLFVVIGISTVDIITRSLLASRKSLREAQTLGYIEMILNAKVSLYNFIISTSLYPFIFGLFRFSIYLLLTYLVAPFDLSLNTYIGVVIIISLTLLSLIGLSFMSCAFILLYKQGDPINYLTTTAITLFSGVFFPIGVLPDILQKISFIIPVTHGLEMMRKIIIFDSLEYFSINETLIMLTFMITTILLGTLVIENALKKVKQSGTSGDH